MSPGPAERRRDRGGPPPPGSDGHREGLRLAASMPPGGIGGRTISLPRADTPGTADGPEMGRNRIFITLSCVFIMHIVRAAVA